MVALGLVAFAAAMALRCPAPTAQALLAPHVPGLVRVESATGSVYSGSGRLSLGQPPLMERINWRFRPSLLLLGRVGFVVSTRSAFGELQAQVGADVLATSCPYCISNFEESKLALGDDEPLEIKDITEVVHEALVGSGKTS